MFPLENVLMAGDARVVATGGFPGAAIGAPGGWREVLLGRDDSEDRLASALGLADDGGDTDRPAVNTAAPDADLPLVARAQQGELSAFDELVRRHQSLVTSLLYRFCPWRADLEDLVQETFVRAYRHLGSWRPEKPFLHWLKRIAANVGLEYCRKNRHSPLVQSVAPAPDGTDPLASLAAPETAEAAPGAIAEAQWVLSHLAPDDRVLLTLLYLEQMPLAEIAEHLGWSRANAKIRAFRARAQLRKILERHGYQFT